MKVNRARSDWLALLYGTQAGLLGAALNWSSLRWTDDKTQAYLLYPKRSFSMLLGSVLGWSEHRVYHDTVGLWVQFVMVTAFVAVIANFALRMLIQRHGQHVLGARNGLVAILSPWLTWLVAVGIRSPASISAMDAVILASAAFAIGAGLHSAATLGRTGLRERPWQIAVGLVVCLGFWAAVAHRSDDSYALGLGWGAWVGSGLILTAFPASPSRSASGQAGAASEALP